MSVSPYRERACSPASGRCPQYADTPILMYQCGPSRKEWRP